MEFMKHVSSADNIVSMLERLYQIHLGPLLLTWFNFNPSMDK